MHNAAEIDARHKHRALLSRAIRHWRKIVEYCSLSAFLAFGALPMAPPSIVGSGTESTTHIEVSQQLLCGASWLDRLRSAPALLQLHPH